MLPMMKYRGVVLIGMLGFHQSMSQNSPLLQLPYQDPKHDHHHPD